MADLADKQLSDKLKTDKPSMNKSLIPNTISVTLAYSPAAREVIEKEFALPPNSTVQDALNAANLSVLTADDGYQIGIWGKKTTLDIVLKEGDRLELYRPLKVDPKVARRERFQKQGARTTGLFAKTRAGGKAGY